MTNEEYQKFIDTISSRSVYEFNTKPNINDKIITFISVLTHKC